ncbi:hypothetical protein MRX96_012487 [Rhipicephalus microplus]
MPRRAEAASPVSRPPAQDKVKRAVLQASVAAATGAARQAVLSQELGSRGNNPALARRECCCSGFRGAKERWQKFRRALWRAHSSHHARPENIDPDTAESFSPVRAAEVCVFCCARRGTTGCRSSPSAPVGEPSVVPALPACFRHASSCIVVAQRDALPFSRFVYLAH